MSITLGLVILTTLISLTAFNNPGLTAKLIFNPYVIKVRNEWYRFLTCGFLHADFMHLFVNMFVLYNFGPPVESIFSSIPGKPGLLFYALLYLLGIVFANISTYKKHHENPGYNALGASGAVSAILFSYALFSPFSKVYLFAILPMPTWLMAVGYLIYSWQMAKKQGDNINHEAHFYGAIFGITFTLAAFPQSGLIFYEQVKAQLALYF